MKSKAMNRHIEEFHGTHSIPCEYEGCDHIIKHPNAVRGHINWFHTEVICPTCGKKFRNKESYVRHERTVHTENKLKAHICQTCGRGFNARKMYEDHLNVHTGEKPYKCPHCSACFASVGTYYGHIRSVHLGKKRK